MKLIRSLPRYRCDYCNHTGIERKMRVHEIVCWKNPNRHCETCNNTGLVYDNINDDGSLLAKQPCPYCSKYDPMLAPALEPLKELSA